MQGNDLKAIAGVLASQPVQAATIPVDNDDAEARYTGFALANHGNQDIHIDLVTLDENGTVEETISPPELNPLGPRSQIARFLHQYDLAKYKTFKGSMVVKGGATDAFVLTALVQDRGMFTALPVMPGKANSVVAEGGIHISSESSPIPRELTEAVSCYPQFVVGGGYSTYITGVNTGDTVVDGDLILTGQMGEAFSVLLDGTNIVAEPGGVHAAQGSNFPIQIAPGATMFLKATALNPSDPATSGWARIEYTGGKLGGVSTFQLMQSGELQTIAGVLASDPLPAATIPVDNNDPLARYTGFAVANLQGEAVNIKVVIVNEDGTIEESLTPTELNPLAGYFQIAKFLHQYGTKYNTFKGSMVLIAEGGKTFIVTALVLNQGLYTAIPVIPGKAPYIQ